MATAKTVTEAASEFGKRAKESMEQLGRSASKGLDKARDETGNALHAAASSVRSTGQVFGAIDNFATNAAHRLDATGSFIEDHGLRDVSAGLRRFARRYPTRSLLAATAIGFLAGSALRRGIHSR